MTSPTPPPAAQPSGKSRACPMCRRAATEQFTPFCSARCRDRDLARWFSDGYAVPGPPAHEEDLLPDGPE